MRTKILKTLALCAACAVVSAQAQTTPGTTPGTQPGQPGSSPGSVQGTQPGSASSESGLSATGRMQSQQQNVRASELMDAQVKGQQNNEIGTISDVIINPQSGKVDFAIIELSSSRPGAPGVLGVGEKQVPVPWSLLKSQPAATTTPGATQTGEQEQTFVFTGNPSKLQNAPAFDEDQWKTQNTSAWSQSIYSHYGVQPGSAMGGGTTPGSRMQGIPDASGGTLDDHENKDTDELPEPDAGPSDQP